MRVSIPVVCEVTFCGITAVGRCHDCDTPFCVSHQARRGTVAVSELSCLCLICGDSFHERRVVAAKDERRREEQEEAATALRLVPLFDELRRRMRPELPLYSMNQGGWRIFKKVGLAWDLNSGWNPWDSPRADAYALIDHIDARYSWVGGPNGLVVGEWRRKEAPHLDQSYSLLFTVADVGSEPRDTQGYVDLAAIEDGVLRLLQR